MELLFVWTLLVLFTAFLILFDVFTRIAYNKYQKSYFKNRDFLLMENAGPDPCAKNQKINVKHHYSQPSSWMIEVKR